MRLPAATHAPANVISVDVEEYFHAESLSDVVDRSSWDGLSSRVEVTTRRILELFATHNIEATFFVLGWVADRHPALVREIAAAGHEIGCHSYWHRLVHTLTPDEFRDDTRHAKDVIEQIAAVPVLGYRAPTYSIVERSLWAIDVLAELGFAYDSSIFPVHHDRYGIPGAPRRPFVLSTPHGPLIEYPIATFQLWDRGMNLPFGGGGYLRLLPWWYTQLGLSRARSEGLPVVAYVHPWEIDPEQPRLARHLATRVRQYSNLGKTYERLARLVRHGAFTSFRRSGLGANLPTINPVSWGTA